MNKGNEKRRKGSYKMTNRERIHEIIFEADTPRGRVFDITLLLLIFISVLSVMLETVPAYQEKYGTFFYVLEWALTIFFTIEYLLRIYAVKKPSKYIFSFFGLVDLLSIVPTYATVFLGGNHSLIIIRAFRLLRVFRIFKLVGFLSQGQIILNAIRNSRQKITVFMFFVLLVVSIFGSIMYLVETDSGGGFDTIPRSIYWAIVTLTTVGYGDISPQTPLGQFLASFIMIMGYAVIAVPTGIVTGELIKETTKNDITTQSCQNCSREGHDPDAIYCKYCGDELNPHLDTSVPPATLDDMM